MNIVPLHRLHVDRPGIAWQVAIELRDCFKPGQKLYVQLPTGGVRRAFFIADEVINGSRRHVYEVRNRLKIIVWLD